MAQNHRPPRVPTTLTPVGQSLTDLLNDGWTIAAANAPLVFTLRKDNKWIMCAADDGSFSGGGSTSQCMALN